MAMLRFGLPLLAIVAAYYTIRCAWWPLKRCRRCKGEGHHPRRLRRSRTMLCRRCRGGGQSIRLGRVVVDRIRTTRAAERKASA
jgi:hypothetical protein